jgi:hypothetical protein
MDHILNIRFANPDADETSIFTISNFKKVLARTCQTSRRFDDDTSYAIVWRSSTRDLVSWDRMGPMLVMIPEANVGPQVPQPAVPELYPLQRSNTRLNDLFFRNIVTSRRSTPQINHVIIGRLILYALRHPNRATIPHGPRKKPIDASYFQRVSFGQGFKFTRFFDSPFHANSAIVTVWNHCKANNAKWQIIKTAAEINMDSWCAHGERGIDVLQCTQYEATQTDQLLTLDDSYDCVRRAENGYITRTFILWLLEKKEWYNSRRIAGVLPREDAVRAYCAIARERSE